MKLSVAPVKCNREIIEVLHFVGAQERFIAHEFEKHFLKFFMPTVRGSEVGSKKRYAGLVRRGDDLEVSFTGAARMPGA